MPSEAVAVMSRKWAMRMGLVTLAFFGFAVWCIYDANVTYPRYNERARAYNELVEEDNLDAWPALAEKSGWKESFDPTQKTAEGKVILKTPWDIGTQYVMMALCLAVGSYTGFRILSAKNKTMRADDRGFHTIEGDVISYDAIEQLDMRRWQKKSIVTVHYREDGVEKTTRIDDWIYEGGVDVLNEIQRRTGLGPDAEEDAAEDSDAEPQKAQNEQVAGEQNRDNG